MVDDTRKNNCQVDERTLFLKHVNLTIKLCSSIRFLTSQ